MCYLLKFKFLSFYFSYFIIYFIFLINEIVTISVSYTHLDVYKRQGYVTSQSTVIAYYWPIAAQVVRNLLASHTNQYDN